GLAVRVPRQYADLCGFLRTRRRRSKSVDGTVGGHARFDLDGRGVYGRADLYRQRAEPDRPLDRAGTRHRDAQLLRLHAVGRARSHTALRFAHAVADFTAVEFALMRSARA